MFDAWGNVLVQDGAGNTLNGLTVLDRGYTGHEHLQSVGLIHMNGRLYDPKLHRFLQPDNYVQDPNNTQNYNRYSYVLNNPLKYIDPSGESFWKSVASVFVSVAFSAVGIAVGISTGGAIGWVGYVDFNSGDWQVYAAGWGLIGTTPAGGFLNFGQTDGKFSFYGGIQTAPKWLNGDSKPKNGIDQSAPVVKPKGMENDDSNPMQSPKDKADDIRLRYRTNYDFYGANLRLDAFQLGRSVYNSTSFGTIHTSYQTYKNYLANGFKIQRDGLLHESTNLLMHEYGHYLHAQYAPLNFYSYGMWSSMATASFSWSETNWTEITANTYSYYYFGQPKGWNKDKYPIDSNYLSAQIIKNLKR